MLQAKKAPRAQQSKTGALCIHLLSLVNTGSGLYVVTCK